MHGPEPQRGIGQEAENQSGKDDENIEKLHTAGVMAFIVWL